MLKLIISLIKLPERYAYAGSAIFFIAIASILRIIGKIQDSLFFYDMNNALAAFIGLVGTMLIYKYGAPLPDDKNNPEPVLYRKYSHIGLGMIAANFVITGFLIK
jgi:positive regulator of sigma E activity